MVKFTAAVALLLGVASTAIAATPKDDSSNSTQRIAAATNFWYPNMDHDGGARGYAPDLGNDYSYPVFVAVNPGDGNGLRDAITDDRGGQRHSKWLASQPRVVYIPPGTYEVDRVIKFNTDTVLMGDAANPPTIKAAANFQGDQTLISGQDPGTGISGELSFTVALKNVILDTTNVNGQNQFTALWWGVAQGAQLQNVKIVMPSSSPDSGHSGIRLGRGSSLGVSDVRIERGLNGIWHDGHQQLAYKNIYFYQNTVAMRITGGNTISLTAATFDTCGRGVLHTGGSPWIALIDCKSVNSGTTFETTQYPSFLIENLDKDTDSNVAVVRNEAVLGSSRHVDQYSYANTVGRNPVYGPTNGKSNRPSALAPGGRYPSIVAPNYADRTASDFLNVKDPNQNGGRTVLGDHTKDESSVLNQILQLAAQQDKIAYFPFGKYRVDSTLVVPPGSRIVGEAWATITGNGQFFKDVNNPKPVVSIGKSGDVGIAHIQDMRFTVSDVLPGAIVVQFNMAGNSPGDVAMWNSLVTVGGTRGADGLTNTCRDAGNQCKGAFIGMHHSKTASAYVENTWVWVADHITEDFSGGSNIAAKGGVLVQSTKGTWLHALGSEHWWLYQLNLYEASNVFVSMLQAETNYDQGDHARQTLPTPWTANVNTWGDPDFSWCGGGDKKCRMGYANFINGGSNIRTYATAAWAFYRGPGEGCDGGSYDCQTTMHWIAKTPSNLQAFGLCTKDATNVLRTGDGQFIKAQPSFTGSWQPGGGDVGRYVP